MTATQPDLAMCLKRICVLLIASVGTFWAVSAPASAADINCSHVNFVCQGTQHYDAIKGWDNFNQITAKGGRDDVWAKPGDDHVEGQGDADNLNGGDNKDNIWGGYGNDSYLWTGDNHGLFGGTHKDFLKGEQGHDLLDGGLGEDSMYGSEHNDWLYSEDGRADVVGGGPGNDVCYVDGMDAFSSCTPH